MKNKNVIEYTFLFTWPTAIVASLVIFFVTQSRDMLFGYVLGVASVMLMQSLNYRVMKNLYKNQPDKIKSWTIVLYIIRYLFYVLILFVVYRGPESQIFYTLGGLMTFKLVLIPVTLIFANKGDEEDGF